MTLLAHGVGSRSDLPVPFWLALYAAAAAVVFSFAALGLLWPGSRLGNPRAGRPLPRRVAAALDAPAVRGLARAVVLALFGLTLAAAFFGAPDASDNPAPWWCYVFFWIGLVPLSLLLGPVWRAVNPLRTLHAGMARLAGTDPDEGSRPLPPGLGYWPAAGWLAAFAWLELAHPSPDDPAVVGTFLVLYAVGNLVAASVYGRGWFDRGDGFEVYATLIGRLAPLGRRADGRLVVRNPLQGMAALDPAPGLVAVVAVLLGSTAFDGVTRSRWWGSLTGDSTGWPAAPAATLGLAGCVAVVVASYVVATRLAGRPAGVAPDGLPGEFAHSVVPIAVGYAIAHYFSLLVFEGQQGLILASDPFHTGADLFGTIDWTLDYSLVSTRAIALVQILAIVAGHVVGVVLAHDRAVRLFPGRAAVRGQYPLLAVMVGYTLGGVTLLLGS